MDQKLGIQEDIDPTEEKTHSKKRVRKSRQVRRESLDRVQLLYDNGINQIKYREEIQRDTAHRRAQKEISACTFTPQINQRSRSYSAN